MEGVAHSPTFAKKVGVPQSVGQDFVAADKARKPRADKGELRSRHPSTHDEFLKLGND